MSMPKAVRHINEVRAVRELFRAGPLSRAELARRLALTRSTVGNIVSALIDSGSVVATDGVEANDGRTGRPGLLLELRDAHAYFVGVEIGVEGLSLVALSLTAKPVWSMRIPYGESSTPAAVLELLRGALAAFRDQAEEGLRVEGLCLTVPGLLHLNGTVMSAPLLGWWDVDLNAIMEEGLSDVGNLIIENDANAFATAETYLGERDPEETALFVLLDSGVGGGLISKGGLVRGAHGYAGEIGHIPVGEQGFAASSVIPGSLESYVGKTAVLNRFRHYGGHAETLDAFVAAVAAGDPAARATLADWSRWLGRGLAMLVTILDPSRIVLGGSVAALATHCFEDLQQTITSLLLKARPAPRIEISIFGSDVVATGAACLCHRDYFSIDSRFVFGAQG